MKLDRAGRAHSEALPASTSATFERDLYGLRVAVRDTAEAQPRNTSGEPPRKPMPDAHVASRSSLPNSMETRSRAEPSSKPFELDWDRIEALVRELDQRIDSMGPVNLDAIQEYDELEERHAFLEKQNNDLLNSKARAARSDRQDQQRPRARSSPRRSRRSA